MATNNKISTVVSGQLPEFVRSDHPTFVAFLQAYYEYLEQSNTTLSLGKTVERAKNIRNYLDTDKITDTGLTEFNTKLYNEFLSLIPKETPSDKSKLLKNIKDFYRAKGTEKSYQFLFQLLYGEQPEIYYPKNDILIASSGKWLVEKSIRLFDIYVNNVPDETSASLAKFKNTKIVGNTSLAEAQVERVTSSFENGIKFNEFFLSKQKGTFISGETLFAVNIDSETLRGNLLSGFVTNISVVDGGTGYTSGVSVPLEGGGGTGATAVIGTVSQGNVESITVTSGGAGFRVSDLVLFTGGGGSGANANVSDVLIDNSVHSNTYNINSDVIDTYNATIIGAYSNGSSGNANTALANTLTFFKYANTGPIVSVQVLQGGTNYTTLPTVSAIGNTRIKNLGIVGKLTINNGGTGYSNGSTLIFTNVVGGYGFGANGNVVVNATGSIIRTNILPLNSGQLPGGSGYDMNYLPTVSVSGAGTGANIQVSALLGYGDVLYPRTGTLGVINNIVVTNRGSGYTTEPTVNLTSLGDGTANAYANIVSGVYTYPGRFKDDTGLLSSSNYLEDRDYYQNFSYVIKLKKSLDSYRKYIDDLVHPAGMKLWGEYMYESEPVVNDSISIAYSNVSSYQHYTANAYYFSNSTSTMYRDQSLNNLQNGKKGSVSFWFNPERNNTINVQNIFSISKSNTAITYTRIPSSTYTQGINRFGSTFALSGSFYSRFDGRRYYWSNWTNSSIVQSIEIPSSNAWTFYKSDGTVLNFTAPVGDYQIASPSFGSNSISDISFSNTGSQLFILFSPRNDIINKPLGGNICNVTLTESWNVLTQTANSRLSLTTLVGENGNTNWGGMFITNDGTKLFAACDKKLYSFTFSVPYDISTLTYDSKSLDMSDAFPGAANVPSTYSNVTSISFANSGTYFIATGTDENSDYDGNAAYVGLRGKFALYQMNVAFDITTSKLSDTLNSMNGLNDTLNDSLHYMPAGLYIKQHSSNLNIDSSTTTDLDIFINRAGLGVGRPKDKGSIIRGKLTLDSTYDTEANTSLSISLVSNNFTNISSDSAIEIKARDNLGYVALNMKTKNKNKIIPNTWNHLIATWDLNSNSNCKIYINDVESTNLISVNPTSNISYTEAFILISGNSGFKGCLSEFWFSNSSINLSNTIIRTQFNGANGNMRPVPLSNVDNTNSNIYTIVYLKANAAFANVNYGKGGDLTFIRSIETCNNSPSDI